MNSQLKMGIKVEQEHKPTYNYIKNYYKKYGKMPSQREVFTHISQNHLAEDKHYYSKLKTLRL
jgi:sulfur relay (sulfurtransferase) DsrC/TusE family protein